MRIDINNPNNIPAEEADNNLRDNTAAEEKAGKDKEQDFQIENLLRFAPLQTRRSGNVMSNSGYLGSSVFSLEPTLLINRPNAITPTYGLVINEERKNPEYGYPCNKVSDETLITPEGNSYTKFKNVKLTFTAYEEVMAEIISLLESGVWL